jgi:hypothetical protein
MLTPAEELGLSGMRLAARIQIALHRLPDAELRALLEKTAAEAKDAQLWYLRDGQVEAIPILACPMAVLPSQLSYVHAVSLTMGRVLSRLPDLYLGDPRVRLVLRLPDAEEEVFFDCWGPSHKQDNPVFGRLDAVVDFTSALWKETLRFLEPNMSGIGGLHIVPTADRLLHRLVVPAIQKQDPEIELEPTYDIRDLLMQFALDHLESCGRRNVPRRPTVCFIEPKYAGEGPDEQALLAAYFKERYEIRVLHADPAELRIERGEVVFEGQPIDVGYRDYSVTELLELKKTGVDIKPMRALLRENRMISSIAADLDQKACWEVLTEPELAEKYFTSEERMVFRRHVPWTRVVSDRSATLPDGTRGDLLEKVRALREFLVLKPNRAYGGEGVLLGAASSQSEWDAAIERALKSEDRWVVQALAELPVYPFPLIGPNGRIVSEPFYTVLGFAPTTYGVSILGRASQKQVVNVAQHGGLVSFMVGRAGR